MPHWPTRESGSSSPIPDVDVVPADLKGRAQFMARSEKDGRFKIAGVAPGKDILKTCIDGYASIEMPVAVSNNAPAYSSLVLALSLD